MTKMNFFYILWTEAQGIPLLSSEVFKKFIHVIFRNNISISDTTNWNCFLHRYNAQDIAMHDGYSTHVLCMRLEKGRFLLFSKRLFFRFCAWLFCAIYYYFHTQNTSFVEQGAWKKLHFVQWGYQALHCVHAVYTWFYKFRDFSVWWWVRTMNNHSKCA